MLSMSNCLFETATWIGIIHIYEYPYILNMCISQSKQQIRCCIPDALGLPALAMLNYGIAYLLRAEWLSPVIQNQFRLFVFCFLDNLAAVLWQCIVLNKDVLLLLRFTDVFHRHFIRRWLCLNLVAFDDMSVHRYTRLWFPQMLSR